MTVAELRTALAAMPGELTVMVHDSEHGETLVTGASDTTSYTNQARIVVIET